MLRTGTPNAALEPAPARALVLAGFFGAAALALIIMAVHGFGERGANDALAKTARFAFAFFWLAYCGAPLVRLYGDMFLPIKRRGRALGLAFAAAISVHLLVVAWISFIGHPPFAGTFIVFGLAAAWAAVLVALSFPWAAKLPFARYNRALIKIGMAYIAFAFWSDFASQPLGGGLRHAVEYLPFFLLATIAPALRMAAFWRDLAERKQGSSLAGMFDSFIGRRSARTAQTATPPPRW